MRFFICLFLAIVVSVAFLPALAFADNASQGPGFVIEGFGKDTVGGTGGTVYWVTNLNEKGPGSIGDVLNRPGPRIIRFAVAGTIDLTVPLEIKEPYVTIDGSDAPAGGAAIRGAKLNVSTSEVIIRYLRVRPGPHVRAPGSGDGIYIFRTASNVVLDHCSISWSTDEVLSLGKVRNTTVQWCMITEGLNRSTHPEGPHSKGLFVAYGDADTSISFHHNLLAFNLDRNPLIMNGLIDFVNNVVYVRGFAYLIPDGFAPLHVNMVNNYFIQNEPQAPYEIRSHNGTFAAASTAFYEGNLANDIHGAIRPARVIYPDGGIGVPVAARRHDYSLVSTDEAGVAFNRVMTLAGATAPCRDRVDRRIAAETATRTGFYVDDPADVGGWPDLTEGCSEDEPVAHTGRLVTTEGTEALVTLTATDPLGQPLRYRIVTSPAHGVLSGTGPVMIYTPTLDYVGPDKFTFVASAGPRTSVIATVYIGVKRRSVFYVSTTGNDAGRGTLEQPWRTLQTSVRKLIPGDTLMIQPGTYEEALTHFPSGERWDRAITLQAADRKHRPVIKPPVGSRVGIDFSRPGKNGYIILSELNVDASRVTSHGISISNRGHHIRLNRLQIFGAPGRGVIVTHSESSHNELIGLNVHHNGDFDYDDPGDIGRSAVQINGTSNQMRNCDVHHNAGTGVGIGSNNNLMEKSTVHNNGGRGMVVTSHDNVVDSNRIYNNGLHGKRVGISMHGDRHRISNNLIYNNGLGIRTYRSADCKIVHNTLYANRGGIAVHPTYAGVTSNIEISNNIVSGHTQFGIRNSDTRDVGTGAPNIYRNNLLFSNGKYGADHYDDPSHTATVEGNILGIDPLFLQDPGGQNFKLHSNSPAIDAGVVIEDVKKDIDGKARPQNRSSDIGAYESGS